LLLECEMSLLAAWLRLAMITRAEVAAARCCRLNLAFRHVRCALDRGRNSRLPLRVLGFPALNSPVVASGADVVDWLSIRRWRCVDCEGLGFGTCGGHQKIRLSLLGGLPEIGKIIFHFY
jgi:hypothetical protein